MADNKNTIKRSNYTILSLYTKQKPLNTADENINKILQFYFIAGAQMRLFMIKFWVFRYI